MQCPSDGVDVFVKVHDLVVPTRQPAGVDVQVQLLAQEPRLERAHRHLKSPASVQQGRVFRC